MTVKLVRFSDRQPDDLTPADGLASGPPPPRIAEALRAGRCPSDRAFDRFLPRELQVVSEQHWTPLAVALRAAEWLDELNVRTVVDIGSGAGKFCVAAALSGHCHFTGLEQRPRLVAAARALARLFQIDDRTSFVEGVLGQTQLPVADAYYLYNPFDENLLGESEQIDTEVEHSSERFARDVAGVEQLLRSARVGTYVITYNGYGGLLPAAYREVRVDRELPNVLRLCRKGSSRAVRSRGQGESFGPSICA